jgi:Bacterial dnaA protein helix-turn-helix
MDSAPTTTNAAAAIRRAKEIRARLWSPANGHVSSELDVMSRPARRRKHALRDEKLRRLDRNWRRLMLARAATPAPADIVHATLHPAPGGAPSHMDDAAPMRLTVHDIAQACCRHYGVGTADMLSRRRQPAIVWARHVAMYLTRAHTLGSLPEIARLFGGRDHTTVLHAVRRIDAALTGNATLKRDVAAIRSALGLDAGAVAQCAHRSALQKFATGARRKRRR